MTVVADKLKLNETGLSLREGSPIREAEGGGQLREIVIISEGWGSSGYYGSDVLKRDIPRIFPIGSHMYLNHPTEREDMERPERSVTDLVGVLMSKPRLAGIDMVAEALIYEHWVPVIEAMAKDIGLSIRAYGVSEEGDAGGKRGTIIKALTEGLSIDYVTKAGAGGKIGKLIESAREQAVPVEEKRNAAHWLESRIHREFTYYADSLFGEGYLTREERKALSGAIGEGLEAFSVAVERDAPALLNRDPYADPEGQETEVEEGNNGRNSADRSIKKEHKMEVDDRDFAELKESVKTLKESQEETAKKVEEAEGREKEANERADRAEEANRRIKAESVAKEAVDSKFPKLPDEAKKRAVESALDKIPTKEVEGKTQLDEAELKTLAESKAESEAKYLAEAGAGTVEGFGSTAAPVKPGGSTEVSESEKEAKKALQESFEAKGMSEAEAKAAVEGR